MSLLPAPRDRRDLPVPILPYINLRTLTVDAAQFMQTSDFPCGIYADRISDRLGALPFEAVREGISTFPSSACAEHSCLEQTELESA